MRLREGRVQTNNDLHEQRLEKILRRHDLRQTHGPSKLFFLLFHIQFFYFVVVFYAISVCTRMINKAF